MSVGSAQSLEAASVFNDVGIKQRGQLEVTRAVILLDS